MNDFEKKGSELLSSIGKDKLKALSENADVEKLSQSIDTKALEKAFKAGDSAALSGFLKQVLSTDEGKRLASMLSDGNKK